MTPIAARIAKVLREHQWRKYEDRCRCDDPGTFDEHPEHVASMLVAELGLRRERREALAEFSGELTRHETRFVTPWRNA